MKMNLLMIGFIILAILLNIFNYNSFLSMLSITWYITSILMIYSGIKYSIKYGFIQFKIKDIIIKNI